MTGMRLLTALKEEGKVFGKQLGSLIDAKTGSNS